MQVFVFLAMLTIYHNPRCRKSREALQELESKNIPHTVVKYLEQPLGVAELKELLQKLEKQPQDIIRKQEPLWKENFKGETFSETALLQLLSEHPKLIERPIIASKNEAVIGRPLENLLAFLQKI